MILRRDLHHNGHMIRPATALALTLAFGLAYGQSVELDVKKGFAKSMVETIKALGKPTTKYVEPKWLSPAYLYERPSFTLRVTPWRGGLVKLAAEFKSTSVGVVAALKTLGISSPAATIGKYRGSLVLETGKTVKQFEILGVPSIKGVRKIDWSQGPDHPTIIMFWPESMRQPGRRGGAPGSGEPRPGGANQDGRRASGR